MNLLDKLNRDLNRFVAKQPTARRKTQTVAIFPCGAEVAVIDRRKHGGGFALTAPDGETFETSLRDLRHFVERAHPGVRFERRPA